MHKRILLGIIFLILIGAVIFVALFPKQPKPTPQRLTVTTSFYPLYFFTSMIVGASADVYNITPAGAEPHDYEPTAQDMARVMKSSVLILNGAVEPWADKIKDELASQGTKVIEVSDGLLTKQFDDEGKQMPDPHVWLDPVLAQTMIEKISDAIIAADPKNRSLYEANTEKLLNSFRNLDRRYQTELANCKDRNIITSHAAFQYLAARYNLTQTAVSGLSPDAEPSAKDLAEVAHFARMNKVRYIFFESLVSPKLAETIAQEIGAKTLKLNPLEGLTSEDMQAGKNFLTEMDTNLANLKIALQCQ